VQRAQADVRPSQPDRRGRGQHRYIEEQAHHIEQHRQLQQVHVVAIRDAHGVGHGRRFAQLEIDAPDLAAPHGADAHDGDEQQHQAGEAGEGEYGVEDRGVVHEWDSSRGNEES